MNTKNLIKEIFLLTLTFSLVNCGYNEDLITELDVSREFAPVALTARVRNQTKVELNWTTDKNADHYVVEFSADDPNFTTIFKTVNVTADELPIQIQLEGLTVYSIRVKAVSDRGKGESTWAMATATTLSEQLMLAPQPGDITYDQATLKWEPGINVTQLILEPGSITHTITAQEKTDGVAIVTGLNSDTDYTATLYNNSKPRGYVSFKTEVDPSTGTVLSNSDDILQSIINAAPGEVLLLEPGDYTAQLGTAALDKSITIRGLFSYDKPHLAINFEFYDGATDVSLINLELDGLTTTQDVARYKGAGNYNSLLISGCNIHDFDKSFVAGSVTDVLVQSVTIENCIVTNIVTNGGDFIDFRSSNVLNMTVTTSTFNNCAPSRSFFRIDDSGSSTQIGLVCNVLLDQCTIYACSNTDDRILYVRFQENDITVTNNLFAETTAYYSNQSRTDDTITYSNNNYFNAPGFYDSSNPRYDDSGSYFTEDPGFVNATMGDFTVTNQTIKDNQIGDPRWR